MPRSADTSDDAARVQRDVYRRMSPIRRLEMACMMADSMRSLSAAGVRSRHPEYTDREVRLAVIRLTLGDELFSQAFRHSKLNDF